MVEVDLPDVDRGDPAALLGEPARWFIHALTAITEIALKIPLAAIGTPLQKCAQPGSRRQPHR